MNLKSYIQAIQTHLIETHRSVIEWFKEDDEVKAYRPNDGGWSISEILEHIALTSHYLLILIDKGSKKSFKEHQRTIH